jgi:hypothetical protein
LLMRPEFRRLHRSSLCEQLNRARTKADMYGALRQPKTMKMRFGRPYGTLVLVVHFPRVPFAAANSPRGYFPVFPTGTCEQNATHPSAQFSGEVLRSAQDDTSFIGAFAEDDIQFLAPVFAESDEFPIDFR